MPENSKESPVALVTGASSGIGAATARHLAERGYRLVVVARREERLRALAEECAGSERVIVAPGDVALPETAEHAVKAALDRWGRLDALVNNAGAWALKPLVDLTDNDWRKTLGVNLDGVFYMTRAALRPMIQAKRGTIVNISSVAGSVSFANGAAYNASKFGLEGMSGALMEEVRQHGIRVTLICPGSVDTEFHEGDKDRSWMIRPEHVAEAVRNAIECEANTFHVRLELRPLRKPS